MNPRNAAIHDLNSNGYQFKRSGGNHDIYYNPDTKYSIPLKRATYARKSNRVGDKHFPAISKGG